MQTDRVTCCVPFCRRTTKRLYPGHEWICADHWRAVRKGRKRAFSRYKRWWRTVGIYSGAYWVGWRLWRTLKREAIERAAGL